MTGPRSGSLMQFWEMWKCGLFLFPVWFKVFSINCRIARAFNRSVATQAVVIDISRSFDRVWHTGLLHKLWRSSFDKKSSVLSYYLLCFFWESFHGRVFHVSMGVQAFIQTLLSTSILSHRLSFFTVCMKMHFRHNFWL